MTVIAVDFDGTLVEHRYPQIGPDVHGAFEWLATFQNLGVKLILWTMRDGPTLTEAVEHCLARGVTFWGVNGNPDQQWSNSPKAYAHLYIDDSAAGCPLALPPGFGPRRAVVNWPAMGPMVLSYLGVDAETKGPGGG